MDNKRKELGLRQSYRSLVSSLRLDLCTLLVGLEPLTAGGFKSHHAVEAQLSAKGVDAVVLIGVRLWPHGAMTDPAGAPQDSEMLRAHPKSLGYWLGV